MSSFSMLLRRTNEEYLPVHALLDSLAVNLSNEQKIAEITALFKRDDIAWGKNKERLNDCLAALEYLFSQGDMDNAPQIFRAHLCSLFVKFPKKSEMWGSKWFSYLPAEQTWIVLARKIILGWGWISLFEKKSYVLRLSPDAEESFQYFCQIFQIFAYGAEKRIWQLDVKKNIEEMEDIFRDHLEKFWSIDDGKQLTKLSPWILQPGTPEELIRLMVHAQARSLPVANLKNFYKN